MITFAAFVPHPLLAIPEISKSHISKVHKTICAFRMLKQELYASKPDTICIISPHVPLANQTFSINQRPLLTVDFSKFGDLTDRVAYKNDIGLGYRIKESVETRRSVLLSDEENLDYGFGVPLLCLAGLPLSDAVRIVPIGSSLRSLQEHHAFGGEIGSIINQTSKRVAVIASGDLSHGSTHRGPVRYSPDAVAFNKRIFEAIEKHDTELLLSSSDEGVSDVTECGLRPLLMAFGILGSRAFRSEILSYEMPLGVGYLTARFHLA